MTSTIQFIVPAPDADPAWPDDTRHHLARFEGDPAEYTVSLAPGGRTRILPLHDDHETNRAMHDAMREWFAAHPYDAPRCPTVSIGDTVRILSTYGGDPTSAQEYLAAVRVGQVGTVERYDANDPRLPTLLRMEDGATQWTGWYMPVAGEPAAVEVEVEGDALARWVATVSDPAAVIAAMWEAGDQAANDAGACADYERNHARPNGHAGREGMAPHVDEDETEEYRVELSRTVTQVASTYVDLTRAQVRAIQEGHESIEDYADAYYLDWEVVDEGDTEIENDGGIGEADTSEPEPGEGPGLEALIRRMIDPNYENQGYADVPHAMARAAMRHGAPLTITEEWEVEGSFALRYVTDDQRPTVPTVDAPEGGRWQALPVIQWRGRIPAPEVPYWVEGATPETKPYILRDWQTQQVCAHVAQQVRPGSTASAIGSPVVRTVRTTKVQEG